MKKINLCEKICICLFALLALSSCVKKDKSTISIEHFCDDCGADEPSYIVNYKTDNEVYYCFDCYWENHYGEKPVIQISNEKWWD